MLLVVDDAASEAAWLANRISCVERADATYRGGYVDIKLAGPTLLQVVVARADEPMRASLAGGRVVWSTMPGLAELIADIAVLPEDEWDRQAGAQMAQVRLHAGYFLPQAVQLGNIHLLHHAAVHAVAAGGRALLALNRTLFQGHKYLDAALADLPRIPEGYQRAAHEVVTSPSPESARRYLEVLEGAYDWPVGAEQSLSAFVQDNEHAWYSGILPPEYC